MGLPLLTLFHTPDASATEATKFNYPHYPDLPSVQTPTISPEQSTAPVVHSPIPASKRVLSSTSLALNVVTSANTNSHKLRLQTPLSSTTLTIPIYLRLLYPPFHLPMHKTTRNLN
ncbi:uncharacterized protein MELLADRAFT_65983 [Melampsora larici-populina 98AG31]|uniref:Uncharacterized protein n=1 Tax=Melampsora larici-populina (strain 98AG31 / pathotype 3-4-7) TaxID=747676 RepID=F4RXG0_MELLP|nr:uncharacterized protein MELLADRAFT_65983 [Melampsora larici-populina 98AG31]EGG02961.1 hypothetical protein MELLADRAFT_65983 [Melampsora larici-populina 98AG31]